MKSKKGYIYYIRNKINGMGYVGKRTAHNCNPEEDVNYLGSGDLLIEALEVYGREHFEKEIVFESDDESELAIKEVEFIDERNTLRPNGYNKRRTSASFCGTDEAKAKISKSNSIALKGKVKSEEHKKAISDAMRGRVLSEEHKRKLGEANSIALRGRKLSEEHKAKLRKPKCAEHSRNLSRALRGRKLSEAHRQAMRDSWARRKQRAAK